ncbi:hypothetical protein [Natrinema salaciae]|uniref:PQQ-like domain-containing protein n=1 Tax=Natrinema salaciae TaxID=1186196 RepID=A0A1H9R8R7_9EURY|nr:hypothetical protein [Natrinema salaciae]SER69132.1 hypothetical protein SAMN04489841_4316 [Natrinema salaciae]
MIDRVGESVTDAVDWLQRVGPATGDADDESEGSGDGRRRAADGAVTDDGAGIDGWEAVESPTSRTLHGVVHGQDGPYACGEGGLLLHRTPDGWRTLLERGPGVADNTLRAVAATDDGCRLWFAGDSGALGFYDVADGHLSDYSAPMEKTSTWEAIAVTGTTGDERVRVANGSGEVLECLVADGCPVWGDVVKPGGGSTIPGLTAGPDGFYAVDTSGGAYYEARDPESAAVDDEPTTDQSADGEPGDGDSTTPESEPGDSSTADPRDGDPADTEPTADESADGWERIGVRNAQVDFQDVWAGDDSVFIAGADGIAYRYDPRCENWTPLHVGAGALQAIRSVGTDAVAVATGGRIYERDASVRWTALEVPTEQSLHDLALARSSADVDGGLATVSVDVAVGAGGTILERDRRDRSSD